MNIEKIIDKVDTCSEQVADRVANRVNEAEDHIVKDKEAREIIRDQSRETIHEFVDTLTDHVAERFSIEKIDKEKTKERAEKVFGQFVDSVDKVCDVVADRVVDKVEIAEENIAEDKQALKDMLK